MKDILYSNQAIMQFVTKMTKEEMEVESKKATLEGMKSLINKFNDLDSPDSDSDSDYNSNSKLESRIHYMKLSMGNLSVDLAECKEKLDDANSVLSIFKKIDYDMGYLSRLDFYLKDINNMSLEHVKRKLALFKDDEAEHIQLCLVSIARLEYEYIKHGARYYLAHIKKKNRLIENKFKNVINMKCAIDMLQWSLLFFSLSIILNFALLQLFG